MSVAREIQKVIGALTPAMPGYGHVYWNAEKKWAWVVMGDSDDGDKSDIWMKRIKKIKGVSKVDLEAETGPPGRDDLKNNGWVFITRKKISESLGPFELMVERSYTHAAVSSRLDRRRADPLKQRQGAVGGRDFKKAGGQRAGQRLRGMKRSRVP